MSDYCEIPEWYSGSWPVARKEHTCIECGDKIRVGEKYCKSNGKWDGEVQSFKQHLECEEACRHIRDFMNGHECIAFGELFDFVGDSFLLERNSSNPKHREMRRIMARVKWRNEKRRGPPRFLGPLPVFNESLERDRVRGSF